MDITKQIASELQVRPAQVDAAVKLLDEGNTVPFISRYRKEATGGLNDEQLRTLSERLTYLRNLEDKKSKIIERIESLGKLNEQLKKDILNAETLVELEDLYRPYKSKKNTRATIAKEKGLEPLANIILKQDAEKPILKIAKKYINPKKNVHTAEEAIKGAKDIISNIISDNSIFRKKIRENTFYSGRIECKVKNKDIDKAVIKKHSMHIHIECFFTLLSAYSWKTTAS